MERRALTRETNDAFYALLADGHAVKVMQKQRKASHLNWMGIVTH